MSVSVISIVLLAELLAVPATSFAISPMSCEFYNATCVKDALANKDNDVSQVSPVSPTFLDLNVL